MELIYNLVPGSEPSQEQKLKYTSIHAEKVKKEMVASKSPGKLFGPGSCKPDPKNFTRKGKGETLRAQIAHETQRGGTPVKATVLSPAAQPRLSVETQKYVPRHTERPTIAPKSNKNYVATNKIDATKRAPTQSSPMKTHAPGEVPEYLSKRKEQTMKAEQMAYTLKKNQQDYNRTMQQVSADEREALLQGLKANYHDLFKSYRGLSVVIDTIPKRNVKNTMEAKLAELEADIAKLERHEVIIIRD